MNYTRISEEQYYKSSALELFAGTDKYKKFYETIVIGKNVYKFAWESDLISPIIREQTSELVVISVDQSFCVIHLKDNLVLRCSFDTNIIDVFFKDMCCIGICEMSVVVLKLANKANYYKEYHVDDIISDYQMGRNEIIELRLLDGSLKTIDFHNNDFCVLKQIKDVVNIDN